ncbi:MAG: FecR domain-containing protein [Bacteroidales bacterium]|nr:FecR domain-containing protein [Bacteroidales bacterium]
MIKDVNNREDLSGLNQDLEKLVSGSGIAWSRTKEEIWADMEVKIEDKGARPARAIVPMRLVRYAAAAVLVLFIGFAAAMNSYTKKIVSLAGEEKEVVLPDDSRVKLYGESNLSYKPLKWMFFREVHLKGEGLFEVTHGKNFRVISEKAEVAVLGTRFLVYSRGSDYHVTCESGKVEVVDASHRNRVRITGGQQAILKSDNKLEVVRPSEPQLQNQDKTREQIINEEIDHILSTPVEKLKVPENEAGKIKTKNQESTRVHEEEKVMQGTADAESVEEPAQTPLREMENARQGQQTEDQPGILSGNREQQPKENAEAKQGSETRQVQDRFRASLSPEQISILEDKQMSREQIRKAFLESLSPGQLELLQEQNAERAGMSQGNTGGTQTEGEVKDQQKMQMQEQSREGARNQNKEILRQQMQENKENMDAGGNGSQGSGKGPGM